MDISILSGKNFCSWVPTIDSPSSWLQSKFRNHLPSFSPLGGGENQPHIYTKQWKSDDHKNLRAIPSSWCSSRWRGLRKEHMPGASELRQEKRNSRNSLRRRAVAREDTLRSQVSNAMSDQLVTSCRTAHDATWAFHQWDLQRFHEQVSPPCFFI